MTGAAVFFQAVRDRWHSYTCPQNVRGGLYPDRRAPIARTEPNDLSASRSALLPQTGNAGPLRLDRMIEVLGVDRSELEQDYPRILRDAGIACVRCRSKRRCFRELEAGTAAKNVEHFCPNADLLMIFADERNDSL